MKENSIEEDIKILKELGQKYYKNGEIKIKALSGAKYIWALQNLLSDYKRVLKINEVLQKENEELKIKNNAIKRESEAYAEKMIRLDIEKQDYFEKYRYHLQQNESLTKEFSNVIPVQKVKDKIEELNNIYNAEKLEDTMIGGNYTITELVQYVLQELIEEREEKE